MRFDPEARLNKYKSVMAALQPLGFTAAVSTGTQDALRISHPEETNFYVIITSRKRGWHIHIPHHREMMRSQYELPNQEVIPDLIRSLWESDRELRDRPSVAIERAFRLQITSDAQWSQDEYDEKAERWKGFGWQELSEEEVREIERRYSPFFFPDGAYGELRLPRPSLAWNTNEMFGVKLNEERREELEGEISMRTLRSLQTCTPQDEELFVLDWLHPCYRLNVHKGIRRPYREEWAKAIFTRGDDAMFLEPDFRYGLFSLRDGSFHVFGERFVDEFRRNVLLPLELEKSAGWVSIT